MNYMLLIYNDEAAMKSATQDQIQGMIGAYSAFTQALKDSGVLLASDRLQFTTTATTLRGVDGKTQVLDGPYAETKEQLGGFYMIEAPDLDAALGWAKRCPASTFGAVEVRPIWAM